jgi:hypothetical protein
MQITLDGKIVEAINRIGSEIWDFADGEVRQLKQDYSAGSSVFTTYKVLKEAEVKVETKVDEVVNTVELEVSKVEQEAKSEIVIEEPKVKTFFEKVSDKVKELEKDVVDEVHNLEQGVAHLFQNSDPK